MTRLPQVGGDSGSWGDVLNDYLAKTAVHTTLSGDTIVGAKTFDVASVPPGLQEGAVVVIDAFTSQAETKIVSSVSGNTVTLLSNHVVVGAGTHFTHASGDTVLVIRDYRVPLAAYGIPAPASADNWSAFQRMVMECNQATCRMVGPNAILGATNLIMQPLMCNTGTWWDSIGIGTNSSFAPATPDGAVVMVANDYGAVSASAADNVFTITAGQQVSAVYSVNQKCVFNDPYGENTLPGGIVSGRVYYILNVLSPTTFTISETLGGAEKDVTSDGTAVFWATVEGLSRVYWDNVRVDIGKADVCGVRMSIQQPGYVRNFRCQMGQAATAVDTVYGLAVTGQIAYLDNLEINPSAKCTALLIGGTGMTVRNFNCNGVHNQDTGIEVNAWSTTIDTLWTESCGRYGVRLVAGRDIKIQGAWLAGGDISALQVDDLDIAYSVDSMFSAGSANVMLTDTDRNLTLTSIHDPRGSDHRDVFDYHGTWHGWTQPGAVYGSLVPASPVFHARYRSWVDNNFNGGTYKVRYVDEYTNIYPSAGCTVEMPSSSQDGWTYVLDRTGGGGTVTITTEGSETIDGAASITLNVGECVTLMSYGTNFTTVNRFFHSTPGTYTPTNITTDRGYDANATTLDEVADVLGTLIADLQSRKIIG